MNMDESIIEELKARNKNDKSKRNSTRSMEMLRASFSMDPNAGQISRELQELVENYNLSGMQARLRSLANFDITIVRNPNGWTLLHFAANTNSKSMLECLLAHVFPFSIFPR